MSLKDAGIFVMRNPVFIEKIGLVFFEKLNGEIQILLPIGGISNSCRDLCQSSVIETEVK